MSRNLMSQLAQSRVKEEETGGSQPSVVIQVEEVRITGKMREEPPSDIPV